MRRFTAFAIVGLFVAAAPAFAQSANGGRQGERQERRHVEVRVHEELPAGCGFLGIYPQDIGRRTAERLGLGERRGAIVSGVVNETGASRAGIQEKDVITGFNGQKIENEAQLRRLIVTQTPGSWVLLEVVRNGQPVTVNAEISSRTRYYGGPDCGAPPQNDQQRQELEQRRRDAVRDMDLGSVDTEMRHAERELENARVELRRSLSEVRNRRAGTNGYESNTGMGLQRMSPQLAEFFKTGSNSGALVNEIADGSPALRAGMQAGDVIVEVNGTAVKGPMDAVKAIVRDSDGAVDLVVIRDARRQPVRIETGSAPSTPDRQSPDRQAPPSSNLQ